MEHAVEESSNIDVQPNPTSCRRPKRLSSKFDAQNRDINGSGPSEIDYLLRHVLKKKISS